MRGFAELTERNATFVRALEERPSLMPTTAMPASRSFVVTCVDPRVEPAVILGVGLGDALVLRNAGGRVTPEVIEHLALIDAIGELLAGDGPPLEVAVLHHTQCGTGLLADEQFLANYARRLGRPADELRGLTVLDPEATVRQDVATLRAAPALSDRISISGHVLDLSDGRVRTIHPIERCLT